MSKEEDKIKEAFIAGARFSIQAIRVNIGGSALRIFDLHAYLIEDYINQIEKIKI